MADLSRDNGDKSAISPNMYFGELTPKFAKQAAIAPPTLVVKVTIDPPLKSTHKIQKN